MTDETFELNASDAPRVARISEDGTENNAPIGQHQTSGSYAVNTSVVAAENFMEIIEFTPIAVDTAASVKASKSPQEILTELRARRSLGIKPEQRVDVQSLNELMVKQKQRNEDAYCDGLRAEGKPIYTLADVTAIGYKPDLSWTQKDLQSRMLYGPVLLPLKQLQKRADDHHQTFVIPGRKAVMEIMNEVYHLFLLAMVPEIKRQNCGLL